MFSLPAAEQQLEEWQIAIRCLIGSAEGRICQTIQPYSGRRHEMFGRPPNLNEFKQRDEV